MLLCIAGGVLCEIAAKLAERSAYQNVLIWLEQTATLEEKASDLSKDIQGFLNKKQKWHKKIHSR